MTSLAPFALDQPVQVIAHRGYSARAPENTIAALSLALDAGASAVEFDLHTAGDGTPVLLHDGTLDRTTNGHGHVTDCDPDDLALLDAGSWFSPDFAGEPVPALTDALNAIEARVQTVFSEIKSVRRRRDIEAIVSVTRDAGLLERTVFISMDWGLLDEVRRYESAALLGPIVEHAARIDSAFTRVSGDARSLLDFDARILLERPELARRAHEAGIPLAVWTVDDVAEAERLFGLGIRRITTNQVGRLLGWAGTLPAS